MDRLHESDFAVEECLYKQQQRVEVYKVKHCRSNEIICMKKIYVDDVNHASEIQRECYAMALLDHPNILKLKGSTIGGCGNSISYVCIFMEYFEKGDLNSFILKKESLKQSFTEQEILAYTTQLISAYAYMQIQNIAHRDIKPQNIFVAERGSVLKVGDLGSAVIKTGNSGKTLVGTPLYLSPKLREVHTKKNHMNSRVNHNVYKSDVFSLGLSLLYMTSLKDVRDLAKLVGLQEQIDKRLGSLPPEYLKVKLILSKMLIVDENLRYDFLQLNELIANEAQRTQFETGAMQRRSVIMKACDVCARPTNDNEIHQLSAGCICIQCFHEADTKLIPSLEYFHYDQGRPLHKINPNFVCDCSKRFCRYCKDEEHRGISCALHAYRLYEKSLPSQALLRCLCGKNMVKRTSSFFIYCESGIHQTCLVCNMHWNLSSHKACILFFSSIVIG